MSGKTPVQIELVGGPQDGKQLSIAEPLPPHWATGDNQRSKYVLTDRQTVERRIVYSYQRGN